MTSNVSRRTNRFTSFHSRFCFGNLFKQATWRITPNFLHVSRLRWVSNFVLRAVHVTVMGLLMFTLKNVRRIYVRRILRRLNSLRDFLPNSETFDWWHNTRNAKIPERIIQDRINFFRLRLPSVKSENNLGKLFLTTHALLPAQRHCNNDRTVHYTARKICLKFQTKTRQAEIWSTR